jgi:hypothetical protein
MDSCYALQACALMQVVAPNLFPFSGKVQLARRIVAKSLT